MIDRAILIVWIGKSEYLRSSSESNYEQYNDATDNCKNVAMTRKGIKKGREIHNQTLLASILENILISMSVHFFYYTHSQLRLKDK